MADSSRSPTPPVGSVLTLDVERPAAGGQMIARHADGQLVFVSGAIPGERVRARIVRVAKQVLFADVEEVLQASPDRRSAGDLRCGGHVLGHITPQSQHRIKAEIVADAFRRLARHPLAEPPAVTGSPERGYRMRARLHVARGRIGLLREGTHEVCDAAGTGQLSEGALVWIAAAERTLAQAGLHGLQAIDLAENVAGTERAAHLALTPGTAAEPYRVLADTLRGLSAQADGVRSGAVLAGEPRVDDDVMVRGRATTHLRLSRDVRAFFQGNRFLLEDLVAHVVGQVPDGPVVDLYAGVGLFGLALASQGHRPVTLVEGDAVSGADLRHNAQVLDADLRVIAASVEAYLSGRPGAVGNATVIVDPPRTGLSEGARAGLVALRPRTLVYVSCDVATLARDARVLMDHGFTLASLAAFDLFPNTAHIESVARFERV